MNQSVRALVAVDDGVDHALVQSALPAHQPEIQIVGIVDGLEEGWSTLQETPTDLLIIACAGYSDRVLFLIPTLAIDDQTHIVADVDEGFGRREDDLGVSSAALVVEDEAYEIAVRRWLEAEPARGAEIVKATHDATPFGVIYVHFEPHDVTRKPIDADAFAATGKRQISSFCHRDL